MLRYAVQVPERLGERKGTRKVRENLEGANRLRSLEIEW
jgi:hypothetical protein